MRDSVLAFVLIVALGLLTACAPGTEGARLGAPSHDTMGRPAPSGAAPEQSIPPIGGAVTCRTAPDQLTRDWSRMLVARGRDYFANRLGIFTRDVDELTKLTPNCPGSEGQAVLVSAVADLRNSVREHGVAPSEQLKTVADVGNHWLAERPSNDRFAPP